MKECVLGVFFFSERMLFSFLQPPAALCLVRMESNLNIKTSSWSLSSPLASNSRHMTSISFPKAITDTTRVILCISKLVSHIGGCHCALTVCVFVGIAVACSNVKCLIRLHEGWNGFLSALCVDGNSVFVDFESMFIHYSEVLVNGRVPGKSSFCRCTPWDTF